MSADGTAQPASEQHGDDVQVELVDTAGRPITERPIGITELLQTADHTINFRDGIALRLEALNAQQDYSDDDADDTGSGADAASSHDSDSEGRASAPPLPSAPPGTRVTNDWYDVLDALRREQVEVERTAADVEAALRQPAEGEGRLVTRNPNDLRRVVATPLKRFSNAPSTAGKSIAPDSGASSAAAPVAPGASRREVWASLAPPTNTQPPHNYKTLRYTSFMEALDCRRFRPSPLAFHAAAAYLNRKDRGQRLLVYGGIGPGARSVEQELYEFSVLTGNWRRIEGRQLVPAGHYGHTITVVEALDLLVVVGGIGPGGAPVSKEMELAWITDPQRAPRYTCLCPLLRPRTQAAAAPFTTIAAAAGAVSAAASAPPSSALSPPFSAASPAAASVGFVPLLFDMNLSKQTWRAIQPATPFPLAFHTSVPFGKDIFVFGGLTDDLRVSGQLLAINSETYAVRLIQTDAVPARQGELGDAAGPGPRFLHTAVRYGPYMIVYGGYDAHNEVCGDCWALDMTNERWERLRCHGEPAGRAGHECCVVGCRMLVTGGFECSLEEARSGAAPVAAVMELNLVPTVQGEHVWRAEVRLRPALPPLAFARCAPCGDDHSFLLFGGLTKPPKRTAARSQSAGTRAASAKRRAASAATHRESDSDADGHSDGEDDGDGGGATRKPAASKHATDASGASHRRPGLLRRLAPFDDGLVFTFPIKQQHATRADDAPVVNELGVEIDPDELPEHFKAMVRRQADFVKKKEAAAADVMRKTMLEEQEGMEPTLYLTEDEIELLLHRSEECCVAFAERYKMDTLPSNVPDRETRIHLIEECVSESRQVRDVIRSMKGSAPGVTAVKSKTHRKRAGQKFEDYSAAKPFRRVVVAHLIESINHHLAQMHRLNKALRTVDWEEKGAFMEAVDDMQSSVHAVARAISGVLNKYIQRRVESLMKGVDRHKEVMRQLTQVVEKNRHDKIWGVEAARDEKRHEEQRSRAAAAGAGAKAGAGKRTASSPAAAASRARSARSRSIAGGYHADESKAVVHLMDKEWTDLLGRIRQAERCAEQLRRYCEEGAAATGGMGAPPPPPPPPPLLAVAGSGPLALPVAAAAAAPTLAVPGQPPALVVPPPMLAVPQMVGVVPPPVNQPPPDLPAEPVDATAAAATAGSARPRDLLVQHSKELRRTTAAAAERVQQAAASFYTVLLQDAGDGAATAPSSSTSSSGSPAASQGSHRTPAAPQPPAPTVLSQPSGDASTRRSRSSDSSKSSSSSASAAAAASPPAALAVLPPPPPPQLPQPPALTGFTAAPPPPPVTAALGPISTPQHDAAAQPQPHHPAAPPVPETPAPVQSGHALRLGSLRPLLAAKEALARLQDKVPLIRVNEWDGNDLAGAPQDARAEELYKRLMKLVTAVAQCVTASFLSKAGARPPRARPPTHSVGPPAAKKATSTTAAAARGASAAKRPSQPKSLLSGGTSSSEHAPSLRERRPVGSPGQISLSAQLSSEGRGNTRRAARGTEASGAESLRLRPLSAQDAHSGAGGAVHDLWAVAPATTAPSAGVVGRATAAPLVPHEALLRDIRQSAPPAAAAADDAGRATSVEVCAVYPGVRTVPNTSVAAAACVTGATPGAAAGPWAPLQASASPAGVAGGAAAAAAAAASTALALSVVPRVVMPAVARDQDADDAAGNSLSQPTPTARRRSTIAELSQLHHPTQHRPSATGSGVQGSLGPEGSEPVTREPVTSITGGNFVVNAEYLSRVAPEVLPVAVTAEENLEGGIGGVQHAWADVDDDYFYFGRPVARRVAPAAATVSGPPYVLSQPSPAGVSVPVGTVLSSPRMNAELTVPRPRTSSSGTGLRNDSSSSSSRRPTDHYLSTTASQAHKSQTARPLVRKDGARHSFYTPGELQLMQARERLRSRPSK